MELLNWKSIDLYVHTELPIQDQNVPKNLFASAIRYYGAGGDPLEEINYSITPYSAFLKVQNRYVNEWTIESEYEDKGYIKITNHTDIGAFGIDFSILSNSYQNNILIPYTQSEISANDFNLYFGINPLISGTDYAVNYFYIVKVANGVVTPYPFDNFIGAFLYPAIPTERTIVIDNRRELRTVSSTGFTLMSGQAIPLRAERDKDGVTNFKGHIDVCATPVIGQNVQSQNDLKIHTSGETGSWYPETTGGPPSDDNIRGTGITGVRSVRSQSFASAKWTDRIDDIIQWTTEDVTQQLFFGSNLVYKDAEGKFYDNVDYSYENVIPYDEYTYITSDVSYKRIYSSSDGSIQFVFAVDDEDGNPVDIETSSKFTMIQSDYTTSLDENQYSNIWLTQLTNGNYALVGARGGNTTIQELNYLIQEYEPAPEYQDTYWRLCIVAFYEFTDPRITQGLNAEIPEDYYPEKPDKKVDASTGSSDPFETPDGSQDNDPDTNEPFGDGWSGENKPVAKEDSDEIDTPDTISSIDPASYGGYTIFTPSSTELQTFFSKLNSPDFFDAVKSIFQSNPLDSIYSMHIIPFNVWGNNKRIPKAGNYNFDGLEMLYRGNSYVRFSFGTITIPETHKNAEYLDYSPNTVIQIFLPYVGYKPLDTAFCMGQNVTLTADINITTGDIVYTLSSTKNGVFGQFQGNCATPIPLSRNSFMGYMSGAFQIASGLGSATVGIATGNPLSILGGVTSGISSIASGASNMHPEQQTKGSLTGGASLFSVRKAHIIIDRPIVADNNNYRSLIGGVREKVLKLNECGGYTVVKNIQLDNVPATNDEKELLMSILKGGIYVNKLRGEQ